LKFKIAKIFSFLINQSNTSLILGIIKLSLMCIADFSLGFNAISKRFLINA